MLPDLYFHTCRHDLQSIDASCPTRVAQPIVLHARTLTRVAQPIVLHARM
jgi:hypothetical protein